VAGGFLALYLLAVFAVHGRPTPAPFDPPRSFVVQGPYRYVRNPMYVGVICGLLGSGLIFRSTSILCLGFGFWAVAHLFVLLYEEPALEREFGETFVHYRQQVRRWLPGRAYREKKVA
jgi:protein-S-isoprenylcysteine O-methyltransferase Ste14